MICYYYIPSTLYIIFDDYNVNMYVNYVINNIYVAVRQ